MTIAWLQLELLRPGWLVLLVVLPVVIYAARRGIPGLTVTVLLLPSTILMGLTFPLASTLFVRSIRTLGRQVGTAYLLANAGSICGVVTAEYVKKLRWREKQKVVLSLFGRSNRISIYDWKPKKSKKKTVSAAKQHCYTRGYD